MDLGISKERLERLIASSGTPLAALTPRAGLELMLDFYRAESDDWHLTCSWGCVTRYGEDEWGFRIELDSSPRVGDPGADAFLLSLVFKIGPRAVAGDFPAWMEWCTDPEQVKAFRSRVEESPPFQVWGRLPSASVALVGEERLSFIYALFDCWGNRDPSRPVVSMTEEQWLRSDDVGLMLRWFRQEWRGETADLDSLLHRYCLACCRRIWRLLPRDESRNGIEVAERLADGRATRDEYARAEWLAEGAALMFAHDHDPDAISRWCDEIAQIPREEFATMIHSPRVEDDLSPLGLLTHAAFFADIAMGYPSLLPKESIERYRLFLSAPLLREVVGNPFRSP